MTNLGFSRTEVLEALHSGVCSVTFTKVNGEERTMRCTLLEKYLPQYEKKTDRVKKANDEIVAAFDLDKNEFRSFRLDSIRSFAIWHDNPRYE